MRTQPCGSWYAAIALGVSLLTLGPLAAQSHGAETINSPSLQADTNSIPMFELDPQIRDTAIQAASVFEIETFMPEGRATVRNVELINTGHVHTASRFSSTADFYIGNDVSGFGDVDFTAGGITADVWLNGPDGETWVYSLDVSKSTPCHDLIFLLRILRS